MLHQTASRFASRLMLTLAAAALLALGASSSARAGTNSQPTLTLTTDAPNAGVGGGASVTGSVTLTLPCVRQNLPSQIGGLAIGGSICLPVHLTGTEETVTLSTSAPCDTLVCGTAARPLQIPCDLLSGGCPPPAITVPASVQVTSGEAQTFTITTSSVSTQQTVTIYASYQGVTAQASFQVQPPPPPQLYSITLDPPSWVWPTSGTLKVKVCLDKPARSVTPVGVGATGGPDITGWMTAIPPADANGVTIPSGSTCETGDYAITTGQETEPGPATIYAILDGIRKNATLTFVANTAGGTDSGPATGSASGTFSISFDGQQTDTISMTEENPPTVQVTVTLATSAPPGGAKVNVTSQGPVLAEDGDAVSSGNISGTSLSSTIGFPTVLTIPSGTTGTFYWQILGCPADSSATQYCDTQLTAAYGPSSASATVRVDCTDCQESSDDNGVSTGPAAAAPITIASIGSAVGHPAR